MAQITGKQFGLIDRLFNFKAGAQSAPIEYSTESPVQPVHELGRSAEIASPFGLPNAPGYWYIGAGDVHAGADEVYAVVNPRTALAAAGFTEPFDVWLLPGIYAWSTTRSSIRICTSTLFYPAGLMGQVLAHQRVVFFSAQATAAPTIGGASGGDVAIQGVDTAGQAANLPAMPPAPIFVPLGTVLATRTVSLLASTIQIVHPMWVGVQGAKPPGVM